MLSLFNRDMLIEGRKLLAVEPGLRHLLANRIDDALAMDLGELTHIVVIQPGDSEADLLSEIGLSPLVNPLLEDDERFGSPDWTPQFDFIERHDEGYFEICQCVADSGFAYLMLIEDSEETDQALLSLCRAHAPH